MALGIPPAEVDMVIFYKDHIEKSDPVVHSTTQPDGFFLGISQAGSCLSGIEDTGMKTLHQFDIFVGLGGHTAQALHYIQNKPFGLKNRTNGA